MFMGHVFVLALFTGRTGSDYAIYKSEAVLSRVEAITLATTVVFIAAWLCLAFTGPFRWAVA